MDVYPKPFCLHPNVRVHVRVQHVAQPLLGKPVAFMMHSDVTRSRDYVEFSMICPDCGKYTQWVDSDAQARQAFYGPIEDSSTMVQDVYYVLVSFIIILILCLVVGGIFAAFQ